MKIHLLFSLLFIAFGSHVSAQNHTGALPPINALGPAKSVPKQPSSNAPAPKRASTPVPRKPPIPKPSAGKTTGIPSRNSTAPPSNNKPKPGLAKTTKPVATTVAPRMVRVNRWVSPAFNRFTSIPESKSTDAQLIASGYKDKVFQYAAFLTSPSGDNVAVVNYWEMPDCQDFILMAEHEIPDTTMLERGYKNKQFLFYAYKTKPATGQYVAVNRWRKALPSSGGCTDFALSVAEPEWTDAQLIGLGYTGKTVQFYVPVP